MIVEIAGVSTILILHYLIKLEELRENYKKYFSDLKIIDCYAKCIYSVINQIQIVKKI